MADTPTPHNAQRGVGQKWHKMDVAEIQERTEQYFRAYGRPLNSVPFFKYLFQILTASDND